MKFKLLLSIVAASLLFTGCTPQAQSLTLRKKNAQQALIIQQQQLEIDSLKTQVGSLTKTKVRNTYRVPQQTINLGHIKPPKKKIKLKKVEDENFDSRYMYPETKKSKKKSKKRVKIAKASTDAAPKKETQSMGKEECVSMIGQDKFDKYTKMFGSEASSIKRCKMLKAMR